MRIIITAIVACACAFGQAETNGMTDRGAVNFGGSTSTSPIKIGTAAPGTCTPGNLFFDSDAVAGANLLVCGSTNNWTPACGAEAGDGISVTPSGSGCVIAVGSSVMQVTTGTAVPGSCTSTKQVFIDTDAAAGAKFYYCNGSTYEASGIGIGMVRTLDWRPVTCSAASTGAMADWGMVSNTVACTNNQGLAVFAQTPDQAMTVALTMPVDWNGGTFYLDVWSYQQTDSVAPYVLRWKAELGCSFSAATQAWTYLSSFNTDIATMTNDVLHKTTITFSTVTGCTATNPAKIRLTRDTSVADNAASVVAVPFTALRYTAQ